MDWEESGAPQGILYIINSNDLPDCNNDAKSAVCMDDNTDIVHLNGAEDLVEILQRELCVAGDKSKLLIVCTEKSKQQGGKKISNKSG